MLGSVSLITGKEMFGHQTMPDWPAEGTDSSLRDSEVRDFAWLPMFMADVVVV